MRYAMKAAIAVICSAISCYSIHAQDEENDDPRANTNLGFPIGAPVNPTAQFANLGLGLSAGAGYNFTRRHAVVGEFMWNNLLPTGGALNPIRVALQNPTLSVSTNVFAYTGNYRFELRGKELGTYFIGGGGWYYRTSHLSQRVTTGSTTACTPIWLWWGFSCESGTVTANQTLLSSASSALGVNGGIGFTARVGEAPYRIYVESRYHYAPNKRISTQLVVLTIGIRY